MKTRFIFLKDTKMSLKYLLSVLVLVALIEAAASISSSKLTQIDLIYSSMFVIRNNTLSNESGQANGTSVDTETNGEIQILPPKLVKDYLLIGGDVLVARNNQMRLNRTKRLKRKAILEYYPLTSEPSRWPNKTIPFDFDTEIGIYGYK